MRSTLLLSSILGCCLGAQDAFIQFGAKAEGEKSLEAFLNSRARKGTSVFLLVGQTDPKAWAQLLAQDTLIELGIEPIQITDKDPLLVDLRQRFGWDAAPRWVALSPAGVPLVSEPGVPANAEALAGKLLAAGFQGRIQRLEAFLRHHPDHSEALEALVAARWQVSMQRFRTWITRTANPKAPISDAEDARIFRAFAAAFERMLAAPHWQGFPNQLRFPDSGPKPVSAILASLAHRHFPRVEAQLQKTPTARRVWEVWVFLSGCAGGRPVLPLLDALARRPDTDQVFGNFVLAHLAEELRAAKAWERMVQEFTPIAEGYLGRPFFLATEERHLLSAWDLQLAPLLEAQLRLGMLRPADETVRRSLEVLKWAGLPPRAAALARACGQVQLAQAWIALPVPEVKP